MADIDMVGKLKDLSDREDAETPFGPYQEEAIVSLAFDHPEFFMSSIRFLKPEMFASDITRLVMATILNKFEQHSMVPTRGLLRDEIRLSLKHVITEDQPFDEIFNLVDRKSDPREVPLIKDTLLSWSRQKAYGLLYTEAAQSAYARKDYEFLEKIINEANKVVDVGNTGFWFFEDMELLFQKNVIDHKTTGFAQLDRILNNGGPSAKEVVCWLAGTNVGKCHSSQTCIVEERLSRIYELELENGQIVKARGSREVQTNRGRIKVADLTISDEFTEIPIGDDTWDLEL